MEVLETNDEIFPDVHPELREWMNRQRLAPISYRYLVSDGAKQIGILIIDSAAGDQSAVLYEVYVRSDLRGKGLGNKMLEIAEEISLDKGHSSLIVRPHSLDKNIPDQRLWEWYRRKGFGPFSEDPACLEKKVQKQKARLSHKVDSEEGV